MCKQFGSDSLVYTALIMLLISWRPNFLQKLSAHHTSVTNLLFALTASKEFVGFMGICDHSRFSKSVHITISPQKNSQFQPY